MIENRKCLLIKIMKYVSDLMWFWVWFIFMKFYGILYVWYKLI